MEDPTKSMIFDVHRIKILFFKISKDDQNFISFRMEVLGRKFGWELFILSILWKENKNLFIHDKTIILRPNLSREQ